ncbi:MAG: nicotinate-nucleotide adenylyltransferase [Lysobacterales bacterium]
MSDSPVGSHSLRVLLGGTFNPVHYGHLSVASQMAWQLNAPVHLVLSARPPHRSETVVSAEQRWEMLKLAVRGHDQLIADRRELDRDGPSFMVDTLEGFHSEYPGGSVALALGSDAAAQLDTWHRADSLAQWCHLVLIQRPGVRSQVSEKMLESLGFLVTEKRRDLSNSQAGLCFKMSSVALEISATAVRQMIASGGPIRYMTPPAVVDYVSAAGLYGR